VLEHDVADREHRGLLVVGAAHEPNVSGL